VNNGKAPITDLISGMSDSIVTEVQSTILKNLTGQITTAVAQAFAQYGVPQVTVQAPPPANVSVAAPSVTITGEDDAGEIDAMDRNTDMLRQVNDTLKTVIAMLAKPVTVEVTRDSNQNIIRTVQSR
jgi:hypothetical protein